MHNRGGVSNSGVVDVCKLYCARNVVPLMIKMCCAVALHLGDIDFVPFVLCEGEEVDFALPSAQSTHLLKVSPVMEDGMWEYFCTGGFV